MRLCPLSSLRRASLRRASLRRAAAYGNAEGTLKQFSDLNSVLLDPSAVRLAAEIGLRLAGLAG